MLLKSFGCSFIFGTDLHDDNSHSPNTKASNYTWPALLAKHHSWDYRCYARPGAGNLRIAESVLSQITNSESCVYVIGWTWIDRFDYVDAATDQWRTLLPVDQSAVAHVYYRDLHSQLRDKVSSLMAITAVLDALKASGQPYIMTYMDHLLLETQWHCPPSVAFLQNKISKSLIDFDGQTFLEWSRSRGHQISEAWHPLESAHQDAFEYIKTLNLI